MAQAFVLINCELGSEEEITIKELKTRKQTKIFSKLSPSVSSKSNVLVSAS